MHFVFPTSVYMFPCRSYDSRTVSTRPYGGLICKERYFKNQGVYGNIPFKNDRDYIIDLAVRIQDLQLGNNEHDGDDEAIIFEIGLTDKKIHMSYLYEIKEHTWVVYGTQRGDGVCVRYNDRIAPCDWFLKGDNTSGLWVAHFSLLFQPEKKLLQINSNFSTYSFTNISGNHPLWPVYAIYYNYSLASISIASSLPKCQKFQQSTLSAGLYLSVDGKTLSNRHQLDSQNQSLLNTISSYIFTESVNIKRQRHAVYALEISFDENRYLPNNTILFETGFLFNNRIDNEDGNIIFVNYDYKQNTSTYNIGFRNGSSVIYENTEGGASSIIIRVLLHFDILKSECHTVFIGSSALQGMHMSFKDKVLSTLPQFFIRKRCTFCTPDIRADMKRLTLYDLDVLRLTFI